MTNSGSLVSALYPVNLDLSVLPQDVSGSQGADLWLARLVSAIE